MKQLFRDESGATAIEYSLIAAMMAVGLIAGFPILSTAIEGTFSAIAANLNISP